MCKPMTVEDFYEYEEMPYLDKFDKKAHNFSYHDMLEFAENYHKYMTNEQKRQGKSSEAESRDGC